MWVVSRRPYCTATHAAQIMMIYTLPQETRALARNPTLYGRMEKTRKGRTLVQEYLPKTCGSAPSQPCCGHRVCRRGRRKGGGYAIYAAAHLFSSTSSNCLPPC